MEKLEQSCKHMYNKRFGEVVMVGEHDAGIDIIGVCNLSNKECTIYIPDHPPNFKYDSTTCEKTVPYRKI
jgi:hypothetical protein